MKWFRNIQTVVCFLLVVSAGAAAQVTCPVLSSGGSALGDGTVLAIGQFATGAIGGTVEAEQGAVPCWFDTDSCPADLDGDADVDIQDLATMLSNFGTVGAATAEDGDLDGDQDVDIQDLAALLSAFGSGCT